MNLNVRVDGLDEAIRRLEAAGTSVRQKENELCKRLAEMGATNVSLLFARSVYSGPNDYNVTVEDAPGGGYQIVVSGQSVAFVEFGAGITYGEGHPQASEFGVGPGTYPGQKNAMTGKGWYLPKSKGGEHTYGNPPNMPMYNTAQDLKREVTRVAREVFST